MNTHGVSWELDCIEGPEYQMQDVYFDKVTGIYIMYGWCKQNIWNEFREQKWDFI